MTATSPAQQWHSVLDAQDGATNIDRHRCVPLRHVKRLGWRNLSGDPGVIH
jgi:hypothetical protein